MANSVFVLNLQTQLVLVVDMWNSANLSPPLPALLLHVLKMWNPVFISVIYSGSCEHFLLSPTAPKTALISYL